MNTKITPNLCNGVAVEPHFFVLKSRTTNKSQRNLPTVVCFRSLIYISSKQPKVMLRIEPNLKPLEKIPFFRQIGYDHVYFAPRLCQLRIVTSFVYAEILPLRAAVWTKFTVRAFSNFPLLPFVPDYSKFLCRYSWRELTETSQDIKFQSKRKLR